MKLADYSFGESFLVVWIRAVDVNESFLVRETPKNYEKMEELKIPEEFKFPFEPYDIQVRQLIRAIWTVSVFPRLERRGLPGRGA